MSFAPTRTARCASCTANTKQTLTPTQEGCSWQCDVCKNTVHAYSRAEMQEFVKKKIAATLPAAPDVPSTEGVQVYYAMVNHTVATPEGTLEIELAPQFLRVHAEITGKLPVVGEPLYARTRDMPALPYGKVLRVVSP